MTPAERVLAYFDRISEAPDAIPRLRRFVLDLAVRGRIADQHIDDEPASTLIERIQATKHAAGMKIRPSRAPGSEEVPFDAPSGWAWATIGQLTGEHGQTVPAHQFTYIDVSSIDNEAGRILEPKVIAPSEAPSRARKIVEEGDVLYSCVRPYLLNIAVVDRQYKPKPIASTAFAVLHGFDLILPRYLWLVLRSPVVVAEVESRMRGQAYPAINDADFKSTQIPVPPLAEQHRIVAKVDELMALCDRLEAAQKERENRRDRLVSASMARLNQPTDTPSLRKQVRFYLQQLPKTLANRRHAQRLRLTILNIAMSGQLAPQDASDEPAPELLRRKAQLPDGFQRRRKILKTGYGTAPGPDLPRLPASWTYATVDELYKLNAIVDYADGNHGSLYPRSSEFGAVGIAFVTAKDLFGGRVQWQGCARLNETRARQLRKGWAIGGDLLLTHNATVGRVARVEADIEPFLLGTSVTFYRLNSAIFHPDYFYYYLQSSLWQGQLAAIMEQTTRNQVSIQKQANFWVAVAPIAEQERIAIQVSAVMALCKSLEVQLEGCRDAQSALLEATLRDALADRAQPAVSETS
jgi:type I restriction enzyme S subunit